MAIELTQEQKTAIERLTRDLPDPREMVGGEVAGVQREALDAYAYGESRRYDTQGRLWDFARRPVNDQWYLTVQISFLGIPLGDGAVPLDIVAGTDGELRMMALVESLCVSVNEVQAAAQAYQKAMQTEADAAVAPLSQPMP